MQHEKPQTRRDRLPRWAQDELTRLALNVEYWRNRAYEARGEHGQATDTLIDDYPVLRGLPNGTRIRFNVTPEFHIIAYVTRRPGGAGELTVHGSGPFAILPAASNAVTLVRREF
jgi:hypothetical protein